MEKVILGKTGLAISRMGFGGIPIQRTDRESAIALIRALADKDINFIDTARAYGVSEEYIGAGIVGMRDRFVLASKTKPFTRAEMAAEIDSSLAAFCTDFIDLYQLHNITSRNLDVAMGEGGALEALFAAKAPGKIGHIGLSTHYIEVFERAIDLPWVETIMFPYNLVETQGEALIQKCAEKGIGFIAMKPFAGGAIPNPDLALRFVAKNPAVTVLIPGMYAMEELEQNTASVHNTAPLTEAEQSGIKEIRKELGNQFCRRCGYCLPCTAGIGIPTQFIFHGYSTRYGLPEWGKERYHAQAVKAGACIGCGVCETRCPYNLPIREMLKSCAAYYGE